MIKTTVRRVWTVARMRRRVGTLLSALLSPLPWPSGGDEEGPLQQSPRPSTTGTEAGDRQGLTGDWSTDRSSVADNLFMNLGQVLD
ncbi:hypothetical protein AB0H88_35335 [Nonomuraea sp. NPDC050680]|uniref:hypothetical protein n=1 Tax=Nonomuraea sp. NPDC050680 TaxID=3154630 RepID=UPI0034078D95